MSVSSLELVSMMDALRASSCPALPNQGNVSMCVCKVWLHGISPGFSHCTLKIAPHRHRLPCVEMPCKELRGVISLGIQDLGISAWRRTSECSREQIGCRSQAQYPEWKHYSWRNKFPKYLWVTHMITCLWGVSVTILGLIIFL